jgi:hypothetical protein
MICYTLDDAVIKKIEEHIVFMSDSFKIPLDNKFNAGYAVKLQMDKILLTSVNDVACMDALACIYREGKK